MLRAFRLFLACTLAGACVAVLGGYRETPARAAAARTPGYGARAASEPGPSPKKRPTICSLVTRSEAQRIFGVPMLRPTVAPLGPTCLYNARTRRTLASVAVQTRSFKPMLRELRRAKRVRVAGRIAYCGTLGTPTLLLSLSRGRVLTIAAPCPQGKRLAAAALPRLGRYS